MNMDCNHIKEKLYLFVSNDLPKRENKIVQQHLRICETCRLELNDIKDTITDIAALDRPVVLDDGKEQVWNNMLPELNLVKSPVKRQYNPFLIIRKRVPVYGWLAVAMLLLIIAIVSEQGREGDDTALQIPALTENDAVHAENEVTVVNFQTSDPNIRIVWFFDSDFSLDAEALKTLK